MLWDIDRKTIDKLLKSAKLYCGAYLAVEPFGTRKGCGAKSFSGFDSTMFGIFAKCSICGEETYINRP